MATKSVKNQYAPEQQESATVNTIPLDDGKRNRMAHIKCSAEIYDQPSDSPFQWVQDKGSGQLLGENIRKLILVLLPSLFS
jgi:hypothetical protein